MSNEMTTPTPLEPLSPLALCERAEGLARRLTDHGFRNSRVRWVTEIHTLIPELVATVRGLVGEVERQAGMQEQIDAQRDLALRADEFLRQAFDAAIDVSNAKLEIDTLRAENERLKANNHSLLAYRDAHSQLAAKDAEIAHLRAGVEAYQEVWKARGWYNPDPGSPEEAAYLKLGEWWAADQAAPRPASPAPVVLEE